MPCLPYQLNVRVETGPLFMSAFTGQGLCVPPNKVYSASSGYGCFAYIPMLWTEDGRVVNTEEFFRLNDNFYTRPCESPYNPPSLFPSFYLSFFLPPLFLSFLLSFFTCFFLSFFPLPPLFSFLPFFLPYLLSFLLPSCEYYATFSHSTLGGFLELTFASPILTSHNCCSTPLYSTLLHSLLPTSTLLHFTHLFSPLLHSTHLRSCPCPYNDRFRFYRVLRLHWLLYSNPR